MKLKKILALALVLIMAMACTLAFTSCKDDEEVAITVEFIVDGELYKTVELENGIVNIPADPIKDGFDFEGWFYDEEGVKEFTNEGLEENPLTESIKVYAKWDKEAVRHIHTLITKEAVAFTCDDDGNIQYWECTDKKCGMYFSDEDGHNEIAPEDVVIPAHHVYTDGDAGHRVCESCGINSCDLNYELSSDKTYYIALGVDEFIHNTLDIPSEYEGKPVSEIAAYAFAGFDSIKTVNIPASIKVIGEGAFVGCNSIEIVNFGAAEMKNISADKAIFTIGEESAAFDVVIKNTVKTVPAYVFAGTAARSVTFEAGSIVESIGAYAFMKSGVMAVNLPASVKSVDVTAFYECPLASITVALENEKYSSETNCLIVADDTSKTVVIGCKNSIIPTDVTAIGASAFAGCRELSSIIIPASVTSIGTRAFYDCTSLENVVFNADNCAEVAKGSMIFSASEEGVALTVMFGAHVASVPAFLFENATNLAQVVFEDNSVCSAIGESAFAGCKALIGAVIPEKITAIGNNAFSGCTNLFMLGYNAENLADLEIGNGVFAYAGTESEYGVVTIVGSAVVRIPANLFNPAKTLEPAPKLYGVQFNADTSCTAIGRDAFICGKNMIAVVYGDGIESWCAIEFENEYANPLAFAGELYLEGSEAPVTELVIPEGITEIGDYTFVGVSSVKSLVLPESLELIGTRAFFGAKNLESVTIGKNVREIGAYAFAACGKLASVTFANAEGWYAAEISVPDNKKAITLGEADENAKALTNDYVGYVWEKA